MRIVNWSKQGKPHNIKFNWLFPPQIYNNTALEICFGKFSIFLKENDWRKTIGKGEK